MSDARKDQAWLDEIIAGLASELPSEQYLTCPVCFVQSSLSPAVAEGINTGEIQVGHALYHGGWAQDHWFMVVPDGLAPIPEEFEVERIEGNKLHKVTRRK